MALSSSQKKRILNKIKTKQDQLDRAESTLEEMLNSAIEEYSLDTAEGKHRTKEKKIEDLQKAIAILESQIESNLNRLRGNGITNLVLRRKRKNI
jgi:hypothetical protein